MSLRDLARVPDAVHAPCVTGGAKAEDIGSPAHKAIAREAGDGLIQERLIMRIGDYWILRFRRA